jgi:hypothetical protein
MTKIKKGRKAVWPKGTRKPLNLGLVPSSVHKDIKAYAKSKAAWVLSNLQNDTDATNN